MILFCQDLAAAFTRKVIKISPNYREERLVFDRYIKESLKARARRNAFSSGKEIRYKVSDSTKISSISLKSSRCFFFCCTSIRLYHNHQHSIQEMGQICIKLTLHHVTKQLVLVVAKLYQGYIPLLVVTKQKEFWWKEFYKTDTDKLEALGKLGKITVSSLEGKAIGKILLRSLRLLKFL